MIDFKPRNFVKNHVSELSEEETADFEARFMFCEKIRVDVDKCIEKVHNSQLGDGGDRMKIQEKSKKENRYHFNLRSYKKEMSDNCGEYLG